MSLPGRRGLDIPEDVFDVMGPAAHGMAKQIWGSNATPEQLQWLYQQGHHTPDKVKGAFGQLPHPHAASVSVDEYSKYSKAHQIFKAMTQ